MWVLGAWCLVLGAGWWQGNGPVAGAGAGRFAGQEPATGTAGTTETTGIVPRRYFALGIGALGQRASCALHLRSMGGPRNGRDARCPSAFGPPPTALPLATND